MEEDFKQPVRRSSVQRMYDSIMDMNPSDRTDLLERLEDVAVDEALSNSKATAGMLLSDCKDEIDKHVKTFGKMVGLSSGIDVVDDMTMGLAPGELTIVAGPTSAFKTGLCLNMAANIAKQGRFVGFITLEMTRAEIGSRLINIMGGDDYLDFFYVNKATQMNWKAVDGFVEKAIEEAGIEILFIDHLHYFARSMENQATELGLITQEFKQIALRHNIPVVLISHTRKTDNAGIERKATMNDLRGSSFIAQDADIVLMVNKVKNADNSSFDSSKLELTLDKNRNRFCVNVGTTWFMNRDGLKLQCRLSSEEKRSWDRNKPQHKNTASGSFIATQNASNAKSSISYRPEPEKPGQSASNGSGGDKQIGLDFSNSF